MGVVLELQGRGRGRLWVWGWVGWVVGRGYDVYNAREYLRIWNEKGWKPGKACV